MTPPAPDPVPATVTVDAAGRPPLRFIVASITLALMPFPLVLRGFGDHRLSYDYVTIIFPVDLALAGMILAGARSCLRGARARALGPGAVLLGIVAALLAVAWLAHPSARGAHTVFEVFGVAVLAAVLGECLGTEWRPLALGTVAAVAVAEAAWSTAQLLNDAGLGLTRLGEDADPFYRFSASVAAPMGSMVHIYVLAALALVAGGALAARSVSAARPGPWLAVTAVAIVPVGFTYSRAGLLALALLAGSIAAGALRPARWARHLLAAGALCLGAVLPAAAWSGGWHTRASQSSATGSAATVTTDRGHLISEAVHEIRSHPVLGVGPGRYVQALAADLKVESDRSVGIFKPVHNLPLLLAAEGGLVTGFAMTLLLLVLGVRAVRTGPVAVGVYLGYLPFCLLDHLGYSYPQGLVITAVWIATLDGLGADRRTRTAPPEVA